MHRTYLRTRQRPETTTGSSGNGNSGNGNSGNSSSGNEQMRVL